MMLTVTALFLAVLGTSAAPALPFGGLQIKFGDDGVMAVADGAVQRYEDDARIASLAHTQCLRGALGETSPLTCIVVACARASPGPWLCQ